MTPGELMQKRKSNEHPKHLESDGSGRRLEMCVASMKICEAPYYQWKSKYVEASDIRCLSDLEEEGRVFKAMYARVVFRTTDLQGLLVNNISPLISFESGPPSEQTLLSNPANTPGVSH
jgi:hypothetical protein